MRHGIKKVKFASGRDASISVGRKLVRNFVLHGKIVTTDKKIKGLKSHMQILVSKAKEGTQSAHNFLRRTVGDEEVVDILIKHVSPVFKERSGGYVKNTLLPQRLSDGARLGSLEWVEPVVLPSKEVVKKPKTEKTVKAEAQPAKKQTKVAAKPKKAAPKKAK